MRRENFTFFMPQTRESDNLELKFSLWRCVVRFLGMLSNRGSYFTYQGATLVVAAIWIGNIAFEVPQIVLSCMTNSTLQTLNNHSDMCEFWCQQHSYPLLAYTITRNIVHFALPLVVIWIAYAGIVIKTCRWTRKVNKFAIFDDNLNITNDEKTPSIPRLIWLPVTCQGMALTVSTLLGIGK